jgi:hypothetical protein
MNMTMGWPCCCDAGLPTTYTCTPAACRLEHSLPALLPTNNTRVWSCTCWLIRCALSQQAGNPPPGGPSTRCQCHRPMQEPSQVLRVLPILVLYTWAHQLQNQPGSSLASIFCLPARLQKLHLTGTLGESS